MIVERCDIYNQVVSARTRRIIDYRPLWSRFVLAAIAISLLDLLIRRVRLFDRKFLPRRGLPPPPRSSLPPSQRSA